MSKINKIELDILMGLPASGKTTYAEKNVKPPLDYLIDFDEIRENIWLRGKNLDIEKIIDIGMQRLCASSRKRIQRVVVDGLFLTNEHILQVIKNIAKYYNEVNVVIHRWNEDRDTCLKNDGGRRENPSTNTILNAVYEEVDVEWLNSEIDDYQAAIVNIVHHKVKLKEDWYCYFRTYLSFEKDGMLRSPTWVTGGIYGNCYDNHMEVVSAEDPLEFDAFDNLLEEICPTITFLHYKKLRQYCVSIEDTREDDYYGGYTLKNNWVCDLQKMYERLSELGYIV